MNETNQYEKVCKDRFDEILLELRSLNNHLFIDNNGLQTRVNKNTWQLKLIAICAGTALGICIFLLRTWIVAKIL